MEQAFDDAVRSLTPEEGAIVRLKYVQGLSTRDVQAALHLDTLTEARQKQILEKLRAALAARVRSEPVTHLTRDELVRWRDAPHQGDRDRIVLHLAACDDCGALYAELMRTRPATAAAEVLAPAAFAKAGLKAGPTRPAAWRRVANLLAAAASAFRVR